MVSQAPQYFETTNSARPQNNQPGIIFGKIDYILQDIGMWQSDGSVVMDFSNILTQNAGFYPQSIIISNPNADTLAVSVNPKSLNYRISVDAASQVRDLCPSFLNSLQVQFGPLQSHYVWQPIIYIITNYPLVPNESDLWKQQETIAGLGTVEAIVLSTLPLAIVHNTGNTPMRIDNLTLQFYNMEASAPGWTDYVLAINSIMTNYILTMPIDDVSSTFGPSVFNFNAVNIVLMPGDQLFLAVRDSSETFTGYLDVNYTTSSLIYLV